MSEPCDRHADCYSKWKQSGYEDVGCPLCEIDRLRAAVTKGLTLIDALMPGIGNIAVQDYRAVNETPIEMRAALEGGTP